MLFFAVALLFLHNVTPHVHAGGQAAHGQKSAGDDNKDLLDFLVDSFQLDFGEGHLECFSQAEGPTFSGISMIGPNTSFPFCPVAEISVLDFRPQKDSFPKARDEILLSSDDDTGSPLRAPPFFA